MKPKTTWTGILAAMILAAPAFAQHGTKVALIDISHIFQHNTKFKNTMDGMKAEIEKFEEYVKGRQQQLRTKGEGLKRFNVGSREYKDEEAALAKESADLQVEIGLKKKDIMEREARVYYEAYAEIEYHVRQIGQMRNIGLVLRYNSNKIDQNDRNSVLQGVNRSIVYQNQLDITQLVLNSINSQAPGAVRQPTGGTAPAPRVSGRPQQQIPRSPLPR